MRGATAELPSAPPPAEMREIVDAALRVMDRDGHEALTVVGVLDEAGLSTRAFYRQFASRDALVLAVYADEQERAATVLRRRLDSCDGPVEALLAWIDEQLALGFVAARRDRTRVFAREAARLRHEMPEELTRIADAVIAPLERILERGLTEGSFPDARPAPDARTIHALVWDLVERRLAGTTTLTRSAARAQARRFSLRALGADA